MPKKKKNRKEINDNRKRCPSLSLCMIVKDEEKLIRQCLNSVKDLVDEIVVVDTGSTDRTPEIAHEYGAKLYHHPWENDFSKHQNQSVDYATGDWVLQMDADEELVENSGKLIKEAIRDQKADALVVTINSFFNQGMSYSTESKIRLFRNLPHIRYEGIVHKQLKGYQCAKVTPVKILHYGYDLDPESMKKKTERTISLIKKQIAAEPENYWHRHNLAVACATNFMFDEAIKEGMSALGLFQKQGKHDNNLLWTYYIISSANIKLGRLESAERFALDALKLDDTHLDSYFVLSLVYHSQKKWEELEETASKYLKNLKLLNENPEKYAFMILHSANEEWRVHLAIADCFLHRDKKKGFQSYFKKALSKTPNHSECYKIMGDICRENGLFELAEQYCIEALNGKETSAKYLLSLAKVKRCLEKKEEYFDIINKINGASKNNIDILIEISNAHLMKGKYDSAIETLENALKEYTPTSNLLINLALAYKYYGSKEKAINYYLKALDLEPDSVEVLSNLGHLYFDSQDFDSSQDVFERAVIIDQTLIDASLKLAGIYIAKGNAGDFVTQCDIILKALHLPRNVVLNSLEDLANVFSTISDHLADNGRNDLANEAKGISLVLNPDLN